MMKRVLSFLIAFCMSTCVLTAQAENVNFQAYTDVPGMPTQDSACLIQVLPGYQAEAQPADEYSMEIFNQLFPFVYEENNRPVRFYDELTQEEIQALINDVDPDVLHMSEYMTVQMNPEDESAQTVDQYTFDMLINADYAPGQLLVAVIGSEYQDQEKLNWNPYLCTVTEKGRIVMHIPEEDVERYKNEPVLLNMLTDRIGPREIIWTDEEIFKRIVRPSKTVDDLTKVTEVTAENGAPILDNFRLFTVPTTEQMQDEIARMGQFLSENPSVFRYFPEDIQRTMRLVFPKETDLDSLVAYEIIAIQDANYLKTNGDVAARLQFAVKYDESQQVIALLGFPKKNASGEEKWNWGLMHATVQGGSINAIFEQNMLVRMEREPGLLVILSDPMPEETQNVERQD